MGYVKLVSGDDDIDDINYFLKFTKKSELLSSRWFYSGKQYICFLRPFYYDYNYPLVNFARKTFGKDFNNKQFLIITNNRPRTKKRKKDSEDINKYAFPIPESEDWKKQLDYYIPRSKYVFAILGQTEGVRWEIFSHIKHSWKYIYCFLDRNSLIYTKIAVEKNMANRKTALFYCLEYFIQNATGEECDKEVPIAFFIRNNKCYYGDPQSIVKCYEYGEKYTNIATFDIVIDTNLDNLESSDLSIKERIMMDSNRRLLKIFGTSLSGIAKIWVYSLYMLAFISWLVDNLLGLFMILIGPLGIYISLTDGPLKENPLNIVAWLAGIGLFVLTWFFFWIVYECSPIQGLKRLFSSFTFRKPE